KEHREALPVSARQTVEDVLLDVDEHGDGSIHSQAPLVGERDQHAAAVDRVGAAVHEPTDDETVDAVGHGAAGDQGLLQELLRAQLERGARSAQGGQDVPLPALQVAAAEDLPTRAVTET